jgi:hypothetical protein
MNLMKEAMGISEVSFRRVVCNVLKIWGHINLADLWATGLYMMIIYWYFWQTIKNDINLLLQIAYWLTFCNKFVDFLFTLIIHLKRKI